MPSWITYDYACSTCGVVEEELVDRASIPELLPCKQDGCGGIRARRIGCANVMRAAAPDGTRRFQGIREQRALQKEERKARKRGDKKELAKIQQEKKKL